MVEVVWVLALVILLPVSLTGALSSMRARPRHSRMGPRGEKRGLVPPRARCGRGRESATPDGRPLQRIPLAGATWNASKSAAAPPVGALGVCWKPIGGESRTRCFLQELRG